jgi:hypothetical protein
MELQASGPSDLIQQAFTDPQIPKVYVNSFSTGVGCSDIILLLQFGPNKIIMASMSFPTAKTLSIKLRELVDLIETQTGQTVLTIDEIMNSFQKLSGPKLVK